MRRRRGVLEAAHGLSRKAHEGPPEGNAGPPSNYEWQEVSMNQRKNARGTSAPSWYGYSCTNVKVKGMPED